MTLRTAMAELAALGLIVVSLLAGCSDDTPQVSIEDHLELIADRQLTPAEVERQLEVATTMCGMDTTLLAEIWAELSERQLAFQDFVFGTYCPELSVDYALATGRALNPEAESALLERQNLPPESTSSTLRLPSLSSTTTVTPATTAGPGNSGGSRSTTTTTAPASTITAPPTEP
jgi:hypothetical protein